MNKPVAWMGLTAHNQNRVSIEKLANDDIPLYTHPVKEQDCYGDGNVYRGVRSKDSEVQTIYFNPVKELTDEEINKLWAESHEDGIAMQQGFTTQQHYFAYLILRKAQEK